MTDPDELLSIPEAASRLGIDRTTLHRWIATGRVSIVQIGSLRRVRASVVSGLVREVPATDPPGADQ